MFKFRTSITLAILAFVFTLGALLILSQFQILLVATKQAASAYMDVASARAFGRLQNQVSEINSLVRVLSTSSTLANSDEKTEVRPRNSAVEGSAALSD